MDLLEGGQGVNVIVLSTALIAFALTFMLGFCLGALWLSWRVARGDFGRLGE